MPRTTRNSLSTPLAPSNRTPSHGNSPNTPNTTAGKRKQNNTPTPRSSASTKKRRLNSPYGTPTRQSRRIAHLTPENGLLEDYTSPRSLEKTFKDFTNILDHEDAEGEDDPKADAVACEKGAHDEQPRQFALSQERTTLPTDAQPNLLQPSEQPQEPEAVEDNPSSGSKDPSVLVPVSSMDSLALHEDNSGFDKQSDQVDNSGLQGPDLPTGDQLMLPYPGLHASQPGLHQQSDPTDMPGVEGPYFQAVNQPLFPYQTMRTQSDVGFLRWVETFEHGTNPLDVIMPRRLSYALHDFITQRQNEELVNHTALSSAVRPILSFNARKPSSSSSAAWLVSDSIDKYLQLLIEHLHFAYPRRPPPGHRTDIAALRCVYFPTYWVQLLNRPGDAGTVWEKLEKYVWLPQRLHGYVSLQMLAYAKNWLFPFHESTHWSLAVVNPSQKTYALYDSLGSTNRERFWSLYGKDLMASFYAKLRIPFVAAEWRLEDRKSNKQNNVSDCGVFATMNAQALLLDRDPEDFGSSGVVDARKFMAAVLLNGGFYDITDMPL